MEGQRLYPIGIQAFSKLREGNYMYVDKTELVYRMTHGASGYMFLSRPRRFGKSLLTSTLHNYFEGWKNSSKGLAIKRLEKEWTSYPVLRFDMSTAKHMDKERLLNELKRKLYGYEQIYGRDESAICANQRLGGLIRRAYARTDQKVVILIDKYDAPLLDVVHEEKELPRLCDVMCNFYSPLKACNPYLRFVFLTGITKLSQLSISSELNNIKNISILPEYATLCGVTEGEMRGHMGEGIGRSVDNFGVSPEGALGALKSSYDGYHLTWPSPDIHNPFSLLGTLADSKLNSYWFDSDTPTYLIEMLNKYHVEPQQIDARRLLAESFDAPTERMVNITPLLYQSGYITIKDHSSLMNLYTLDIPNKEVRMGLMKSLLPNYLHQHAADGLTTVALLFEAIAGERVDDAPRLLQTFLSIIPQCDNTDCEGHYQSLLYTVLSLLGMYMDMEARTPKGRVGMVIRILTTLYIVELKLNKAVDIVLEQINLRNYPKRFALCGLSIAKAGTNFGSGRHTLGDWVIEGYMFC